jgi:hypothetical protein
MYSRLCPWLLTWSNYEEGYEDGEEFNDTGANKELSPNQSPVG